MPALPSTAAAQEKTITVFAAASMKNALDDVNAAFTKKTGIKVVASYAASSALMKQIEQGAPADVFLSADLDWMDYGSQKKLVQGRHPRQPARQQAGADRAEGFQDRQRDHRPGLRSRRSSPATAASRPATCARCRSANTPRRRWRSSASGRRSSRSSRWPRTCARRSSLVARGEAPLGIVYETDAKVEPNVKIVGAFPDGLASADHLSGGADHEREAGGGALSRVPALADRRRRCSRHYGFTFLIRPTS